MKKKILIGLVMFVIMFSIVNINTYVFADARSFVEAVDGDNTDIASQNSINNVLGIILGAVQIVAIGVAIIMLSYLGIKYMSAAPSERANIKNQLISYVVGAVLAFGAAKILEIAMGVSQSAFN